MRPNVDQTDSAGPASWAVLGGTGFVGTGVVEALTQAGAEEVRKVRAPRLVVDPRASVADVLKAASEDAEIQQSVKDLVRELGGADIVVNAAGLANPNDQANPGLFGANSLLPVVVAEACARAGVRRMLHLSSAAVQGRRPELDETEQVEPFSAYSASKALGEQALAIWERQRASGAAGQERTPGVAILRATSVQGPGRGTSAGLSRIASSRLSSVAAPGTQPSVVSSLAGLSEFVLAVGTHPGELPPILLQPWEGGTVRDVLALSGHGRDPAVLPAPLARTGVAALYAMGRVLPRARGLARRLEVMWFGQRQVLGWASRNGLVPGEDPGAIADTERGAPARPGPGEHLIRTLSGAPQDPRLGGEPGGGGPRKESP